MTLKLLKKDMSDQSHSTRNLPIVAIDGPAGAGKSTAARLLAAHLGFTLIDTGAIYRSLALQAIERNISLKNGNELALLCEALKFSFGPLDKSQMQMAPNGIKIPKLHVYCNGLDVTDAIRSPELGMAASNVSKLPEVREALLSVQRDLGREGGIVMEGRDIGTVIFPDAEIKFFLEASLESRAQRRMEELKAAGIEKDIESVIKETKARDEQDMNRDIAPLKKAEDAFVIDSTQQSLEDVVRDMSEKVRSYLKS